MTQTVKYGIPTSEMLTMLPQIRESQWVNLVGVHTHSGRHSKKDAFWRSLVSNFVKLTKEISDGIGGMCSGFAGSIG